MRREESKWWSRGYTQEWWDALPRHEREKFLAGLSDREVEEFFRDWRVWARDEQLMPDWSALYPGEVDEEGNPLDWDTWLMKCGRGFGKTRTAVETILDWVEEGWARRIAIVGQGEDDVRNVMVNGESGFMECAPSWNKPTFRPSVGGGVLIWPNGCQAFIYSIADTEALRGPQFHAGWCDEPMAAPRVQRERAMDNLEFCLRLGVHPRLILTCTPKPDPWLREIIKKSKDPANRIHLTEGDTYANQRNLAANFLRKITRNYGGTKKGKQEIEGKILGDEEGALWTEETLDKNRLGYEEMDPVEFAENCDKVIIGVDPNTKGVEITKKTASRKLAHAAGIVVTGRIGRRKRFVLGDETTSGGPSKWGKAAVLAAIKYDADEFTVEGNQGGEMVKIVLEQAMDDEDFHIPVHINWSKRSKAARAEPASHVYDKGEVHHVGPKSRYEDLEMQMMYLHEGEDPTGEDFDRCDALVSALARHGLKRRLSSGKSGAKVGIRTIGEVAHGASNERASRRYSPDWGEPEL